MKIFKHNDLTIFVNHIAYFEENVYGNGEVGIVFVGSGNSEDFDLVLRDKRKIKAFLEYIRIIAE